MRIIDLATGKEIAHLGGQGGNADVAWLPGAESLIEAKLAEDSEISELTKRVAEIRSMIDEQQSHRKGFSMKSVRRQLNHSEEQIAERKQELQLPVNEGAPLLVIAADGILQVFRITAEQAK